MYKSKTTCQMRYNHTGSHFSYSTSCWFGGHTIMWILIIPAFWCLYLFVIPFPVYVESVTWNQLILYGTSDGIALLWFPFISLESEQSGKRLPCWNCKSKAFCSEVHVLRAMWQGTVGSLLNLRGALRQHSANSQGPQSSVQRKWVLPIIWLTLEENSSPVKLVNENIPNYHL